jgi:hypothetical protein
VGEISGFVSYLRTKSQYRNSFSMRWLNTVLLSTPRHFHIFELFSEVHQLFPTCKRNAHFLINFLSTARNKIICTEVNNTPESYFSYITVYLNVLKIFHFGGDFRLVLTPVFFETRDRKSPVKTPLPSNPGSTLHTLHCIMNILATLTRSKCNMSAVRKHLSFACFTSELLNRLR